MRRTFSRAAKALAIEPVGANRVGPRTTAVECRVALTRISNLVLEHAWARDRLKSLQDEARSLSINLASTYEEISLLHRLTQNLKLSKSDEDLAQVALEWMQEVVPAAGLAIQFAPAPNADKSTIHAGRKQPVLLSRGECPIDAAEFSELIRRLAAELPNQPIVANRPITGQPDWPFPQIRQIIAVPLAEGENVFGWLAALNHAEDGEFGTVEASLSEVRGRNTGHPQRQHRTLSAAIGIAGGDRAGIGFGHRRQRSLHVRSQRPRGARGRSPGPGTELRPANCEYFIFGGVAARHRQDRH